MMADPETLAVYAAKVEAYREWFASDAPDEGMQNFLKVLPPHAKVLDLGCGPGHALVHLTNAGHEAEGLDAVHEFVELARDVSGRPVTHGTFDDIECEAEFDAVFANFSLLHAPKADLPRHLSQIAIALKPGGIFHIGLKTGTGEHRDTIGRFYAYYTVDELTGLLAEASFKIISTRTGADPGLDGTVAPWVVMLTRKI